MGVAGLIFAAMDSQRARYVTAFVACVLSNCVDEFVKKDEFSKGPKLPLVQRWANEVVLGVQAYFESLGVVAAERQQDDFHGVAVNTNLCLLCRCMTTLMPMFRPNDDNHPVDEWNLGDLSTYHIKSLAKLVIQLHPRIFDAISRSQFLQSDAEPMGQLETAPRDFGLLSFLLLDEWPVVYAPTFKLAHCLRNSVLLVGWADSVKNDDRFTILRIGEFVSHSPSALELFVHATIWMPVCSQEPYNERFSTSYGSAVAPDLVVSSIFKILASTPLSDPWKRHAHSGLQAFLGLFPLHVATAAVALVVEDTASEVVRASAATLFRRELALRPESIRPEVVNTAHRVLACLLAEQGTVVDMATVYSEGTLLFYAMNTRPDLFSKPDASLLRTLSKKIDIELKSENEVFMQGRPALALVGHNLSRALGS
ncbi:MAG: uncharacterized protein KVP18_001514 [Porospora cf. gigantea A]|uniref:uncharacterized protein n=1 Tax=Porospora cf. gigantea A TaxID=2853593 RepID=UPI003559DEA7|nr:MAG: hypothetical protein KVP18_001514 [Porospora cf. gigantea A]